MGRAPERKPSSARRSAQGRRPPILSEGPKRQLELRREARSPAQSTLRAHLKSLEGIGAIARQRRNAFPGTVEYELEKPGEELLFVAATLKRWLAAAPQGPSRSAAIPPRLRSERSSTAGPRPCCAPSPPARSRSPSWTA